MPPVSVGAALITPSLPRFRTWLIEGQRDLELQDFIAPQALLQDWTPRVAEARRHLDGFEGRLGIHGPFINLSLDANDPEIRPIVTQRFLTALEVAEALGATQMVVHSPFSTWDGNNFPTYPEDCKDPWSRAGKIENARQVMAPVVARAEVCGVTLVIENIEDKHPMDRKILAESFDSDAMKLSVDTGHAHYAHVSTGAPSAPDFIRQAGETLAHVHLQDTDGRADRHWPPGRGSIDWHGIFAALAELETQPHLVLELFDGDTIMPAFNWLKAEGLVI